MSCEGCTVKSLCQDQGRFGKAPHPLCYTNQSLPEPQGHLHGVGTSELDRVYSFRTSAQRAAVSLLERTFGRNCPVPVAQLSELGVIYHDTRRDITLIIREDSNPSNILPLQGSFDISSEMYLSDGTRKREKRHFGFRRSG